jgi:hypothetical protein
MMMSKVTLLFFLLGFRARHLIEFDSLNSIDSRFLSFSSSPKVVRLEFDECLAIVS